MKDYVYILLDLDGTIINSAEGITKCAQYALAHLGIREEDLKKLYGFIGPPLKDSFRYYYRLTEEECEKAIVKYRERYSLKGIHEHKIYEGIPDLLAHWKQQGKQIMLCTSKPEKFAREILEELNLLSYFTFVGGATFDGQRNRKAEVIEYVLEKNGITDRSRVVMVGDRKYDVEGALETGIDSVGVTYGFGSREELETAGATYIATGMEELKQL